MSVYSGFFTSPPTLLKLKCLLSEIQFKLSHPKSPESVCSLPCDLGQAKKYVEGESCCWHCFNCTQYQVRQHIFTISSNSTSPSPLSAHSIHTLMKNWQARQFPVHFHIFLLISIRFCRRHAYFLCTNGVSKNGNVLLCSD